MGNGMVGSMDMKKCTLINLSVCPTWVIWVSWKDFLWRIPQPGNLENKSAEKYLKVVKPNWNQFFFLNTQSPIHILIYFTIKMLLVI